MKRICFYLTYDRQKIIDEYIGYMLGELKTCVEYLVVICNNEEIICGRDILEKYADDIFCRKNIGFDAGGFKDALCNFVGWDKVLLFDELVLVNDSMFGPFRPMKNIFEEMDDRVLDFWGLAKHSGYEGIHDYFPEHIQSFFFVIRERMLHSDLFKAYWEDMPYYESFNKVIREYEMKFTPYFAGHGYSYGVLADMHPNDSENLANNHLQFETISYELIKKRNFPFLKKQQITHNTLDKQTQENLGKALAYIDQETDYNVDLIWDNIIRTLNVADLQRSLHLQYIISAKTPKYKNNVEIILFVSYENSVEYILEYLQILHRFYSIKIFSYDRMLLQAYQEQGYLCEEIVKDGILDIFRKLVVYDYVCVLHDVDMGGDKRYSCTGKSLFYNIWENLARNDEHVSAILELFEKESKLGLLASPQPNFAEYFGDIGKGWEGKYEEVCRIATTLKLNCQISREIGPFRVTCDFWARGSIFARLEEMEKDDFEYLPYLWSFLAQDAGFCSGIVESKEYASMNEVNLQYYITQIAERVRNQYGDFEDFMGMEKKISEAALKEFCEKYSYIYIYGTGYISRRYKDLVGNIEAFVVSDGQKKLDEVEGLKVKYLSEIPISNDCGIVICLRKKDREDVIKLLKNRGIKHYIYV